MIAKLFLTAFFAALFFGGCSSREIKEIDYKTQQENSQKAFDEL